MQAITKAVSKLFALTKDFYHPEALKLLIYRANKG